MTTPKSFFGASLCSALLLLGACSDDSTPSPWQPPPGMTAGTTAGSTTGGGLAPTSGMATGGQTTTTTSGMTGGGLTTTTTSGMTGGGLTTTTTGTTGGGLTATSTGMTGDGPTTGMTGGGLTTTTTTGMTGGGLTATSGATGDMTTTGMTTGGATDVTGMPDGGMVEPDGGMMEPDAGPVGPAWENREDLGKGDGSDVVCMGDSWMDYFLSGGGIQTGLDRLGLSYRKHGLSATKLLDDAIPDQFDDALRRNPDIKTVIMTGGGNDVLLVPNMQRECANETQVCRDTLDQIGARLGVLWAHMAENGVQDVVYIGYSKDAGSSGPKAADLDFNGIQTVCDEAPLNCHTIRDSTELVDGDFVDGIHPTRGANDRLAKAIYEMMEERKMRR